MTAYAYRCSRHGDFDLDFPMGEAPPSVAHACGQRSLRVLGGARISVMATPNRPGYRRVSQVDRTEARWATDLPAYKRMRDKGLQPKSTEGCAALENRVDSQFDINYDRAIQVANHLGGGKNRVVDAIGEVGGVM